MGIEELSLRIFYYILYRLISILRRILFRVNFTTGNFIRRIIGYYIDIYIIPRVILRAIKDMERLDVCFPII